MTAESERARERRLDGYTEHEVLGYVEYEHSMNGRPCPYPWAVLQFRRSGALAFYCGECGVGAHSGGTYDELLARWGGAENTNPNARSYPVRGGTAAAKVRYGDDAVYRVPPDRMRECLLTTPDGDDA